MGWNYKKFLSEPRIKFIGFGVASGIIAGLIYPGGPFDHRFFGGLVFIALIPLFYSLFSEQNNHKFLTGFCAGLVYFLIVFRWFWSLYPLTAFGIENGLLSFFLILISYLISSAAMALLWGLFAFSISKLETRNLKILIIPALFVLTEFLRSVFFGLVWLGSGSLIGPYWTMGNLAYSLHSSDLTLWFSSYVGIYGLTFLIVLANVTIYHRALIFKEKKYLIVVALLIFVLPVIKLPEDIGNTGKKLNYAIIQTSQSAENSISPSDLLTDFKKQLALLNDTAKKYSEVQIVVFPEATDLFKNISRFLTPVQVEKYFTGLFKEPRLIVSGSKVFGQDDKPYSRVFYLNSKKDIMDYYDKRLLMPGGEFAPYLLKIPAKILPSKFLAGFSNLRGLSSGQKGNTTVNFENQFSATSIVCSEILSPSLVSLAARNADVILGMTSYGVFNGNETIARQTLANAQFRAAENQKPVILASNMGFSYVIDTSGQIINQTKDKNAQILTGSIALNSQKSWYNKVGNLPTILASLALIISFGLLTAFRKIKGGS